MKRIRKPLLITLVFSLSFLPVLLGFQVKSANAQGVVTDPVETGVDIENGVAGTTTAVASGTSAVSSTTTALKSVADIALQVAEHVAMGIAKNALAKMTQSTVNWINGGYEGAPLFVQDPKSFYNNIADTEVQSAIDYIGYNTSAHPFGREVAQALIPGYVQSKVGAFAGSTKFTLNQNLGKDWQNFDNDFSQGGWDGWDAKSTNPENNPFGSFLDTDAALNQNLDKATTQANNELTQNKGFLSVKECTSYTTPSSANAAGNADAVSACQDLQNILDTDQETLQTCQNNGGSDCTAEQADVDTDTQNVADCYSANGGSYTGESANPNPVCTSYKTNTPGGLVSDQITTAMGSTFRQSELGQALGNDLSLIFDTLISSLVNKGLNALSDAVSTTPNTADNTSTFSYFGQTLGTNTNTPNTSNASGSNWASGPDQIVDIYAALDVPNPNPTVGGVATGCTCGSSIDTTKLINCH